MSLATLERVIVAAAREALNNPKLRVKDIQEWSTGEIEPDDGKVVIYLDDPGVYAAFKCEHDRRHA